MQLKALRKEFAQRIVTERQGHGAYRSLQDLVDRLKPEVAQATLLIKAGCFDPIAGELTRPALIWRLFAAQSGKPAGYLPIPPEYSPQQKLSHELELFGFPLSGHPLELFTQVVSGLSHLSTRELAQHVGKEVTLLGWMVTEKMVSTKKGEPMEFVTSEDQTSLYDATFFPDTYRRYCHLLASDQAYSSPVWWKSILQQCPSRSQDFVRYPLPTRRTPSHVRRTRQNRTLSGMTRSPLIRFGTSTWTYEGWKGQIYTRAYTKTGFTRDCLGEFCQYLYKGEPLFRTVGNDATFYRPPTVNQLTRYLRKV